MALLNAKELDRLRHSSYVFRSLDMDQRLQYMNSDGTYQGPDVAAATVIADTGGIAANDIAYVSGYDSTTGHVKLKKAQANAAATCEDLYWCPSAITAGAEGFAYMLGSFTSTLTNSGSIGDPVYLSAASAGVVTGTMPTGTNVVKKIGSFLSTGATAIVHVELAADDIPVHTHADNSQGGAITTPALAGTSGTSFLVFSGGATAKISINTNSATGNFTSSWVTANLTADRTITFPDLAGTVALISAKQSLTALGATSGGIVISPTATGAFNFTIANQVLAAAQTLTLPAITDNTHYFAVTDQADGSVVSTASTGTSNATFSVATNLILSSAGQTGAHIFTFPDGTSEVVTLAASQTLIAKTLSSPHIAGGAITLDTATTVTGTWANLGTVTTVDVNGGTIDGVTIGGSAAGAGTFTTVNAATVQANGTTSGGIKLAPIATGTALTSIVNTNQAAITITLPSVTSTLATIAGTETLTGKSLTAPAITGGTAIELTGLSIRSTGAAFDVLFASSDATLGADRTITINPGASNRTIALGGDLTLVGACSFSGAISTVGDDAVIFRTSAATDITLPTTGTVATLAGTESFTNKTYDCAGTGNVFSNLPYTAPAVGATVDDATVGVPFVLEFTITSADLSDAYTVPVGKKLRVLDAKAVKIATAGGASDTVQVLNAANPITDAMSLNVSDKVIVRAGSIDDAFRDVAAAAALTVTGVEGTTDVDCIVTVTAMWVTP